MDLLRKKVDSLAEENRKLLGHQNPNQKIQYLVKLKKDYTKLAEVSWGVEDSWSQGLAATRAQLRAGTLHLTLPWGDRDLRPHPAL